MGEDTPTEKYCLEAKQWQAALQEARKRRGDAGPLSRFSIELLENGYRAVDPAQQLRYVVNKAPTDAVLSEGGAGNGAAPPGSFPAPAVARVAQPVEVALSSSANTDPMAAPISASDPLKTDPMAAGPRTDPMGAPPPSAPPNTSPMPTAAAPTAPAARPPSTRPPRPVLTVPEDVVPRSPTAPPATAKLDAAQSTTQPLTPPPEARRPNPAQMTQRSIEATREPDFQLIKKREEEPTEKTPITYREFAYAVKPGTDRQAAEVLLWLRFREVVSALNQTTTKKFIQLAVFDHVFEHKPARPPIATLAWKDWRGEPVLQFPGTPTPSAPPPPSAPHQPSAPPRPPSNRPPPPSAGSSPEAAARLPSAPPPPTAPSAPQASTPLASAPSAPLASAPSAPPTAAPAAPFPAAPSAPHASAPSAPLASAPSAPAASPSAPPAPMSAVPSTQARSMTVPSPIHGPLTPSGAPTEPIRRRAGEDLIGELFESMHDLHFLPDMMSGVDFVLNIVMHTLPSEAVLIHVFDINTRQFIVVRALGPSPHAVVLHRTPDQDDLFRRAMRVTRATRVANASGDPNYANGRWELLGVGVNVAMLGPVQLAGRFLGAIELANPLGGEPYSEHESHALDYICEQFAEFLAARPIVVDADVVLGKG